MTIRTLVLSGGGGRGAFHAGVYKYLMQTVKNGVDSDHQGAWEPDIIIGTSIGAVNGAAITQGISADDMVHFWENLRSTDVQGLPPGMSGITKRVMNVAMRKAAGMSLNPTTQDSAFSPVDDETWLPAPFLPKWMNRIILGRWGNLLDTGPLYKTLTEKMGITQEGLSNSDKTLLISTTNVASGEGVIFSNKPAVDPSTGDESDRIRHPITVRRIVASCSIPMVYPWTKDGADFYWDGAVVENTPLGSAFEVCRDRPIEEPMEIVVVMMTPWIKKGQGAPNSRDNLPKDFSEAILQTLDWALLASFRAELKKTQLYRRLAEMDMEAGNPPTYRYSTDVIVAPDKFMPVTRIITYDEGLKDLITDGYDAAQKAFQAQFSPDNPSIFG